MSKFSLAGCRLFFRFAVQKLHNDQDILTCALAAVWTCIMFVLLLLPSSMIPLHMAHNEDKAYHFVMFMVFAVLVVLCMRNYKRVFRMTNSSFVMAIGAGYTILTEVMQGFVPGRSTSVMDGLANIAGVFVGILITNLIIHFYAKPKTKYTGQEMIQSRPIARQGRQRTELRTGFFYTPGQTP